MAEINRIVFDYREIVTELLKKENIHEGIWMLYLEFGLAAVNAPVAPDGGREPKSEDEMLNNLMPTAILPVKKIGIQRTEKLSNLAVDAAVANPKQSTKSTGGKKTK